MKYNTQNFDTYDNFYSEQSVYNQQIAPLYTRDDMGISSAGNSSRNKRIIRKQKQFGS